MSPWFAAGAVPFPGPVVAPALEAATAAAVAAHARLALPPPSPGPPRAPARRPPPPLHLGPSRLPQKEGGSEAVAAALGAATPPRVPRVAPPRHRAPGHLAHALALARDAGDVATLEAEVPRRAQVRVLAVGTIVGKFGHKWAGTRRPSFSPSPAPHPRHLRRRHPAPPRQGQAGAGRGRRRQRLGGRRGRPRARPPRRRVGPALRHPTPPRRPPARPGRGRAAAGAVGAGGVERGRAGGGVGGGGGSTRATRTRPRLSPPTSSPMSSWRGGVGRAVRPPSCTTATAPACSPWPRSRRRRAFALAALRAARAPWPPSSLSPRPCACRATPSTFS